MKASSIFQRKMLETTRGIAGPHRKYQSIGTVYCTSELTPGSVLWFCFTVDPVRLY